MQHDEILDKARTLAPKLKAKYDERKLALISAKKRKVGTKTKRED